ncbi:alpha/beta fold hydrolase [Haloarchaeobius iranensis]|uniref:Pimeloyl-ACP methyl ester carboxylesterase n=1 Tax=Haloarchaeobius iranensis TaxID=996166 RepID=A0A1H0AYT1_9EURY|nr:alpha/beta fold hydrolase [Haloarchaeobius iranensis]SDN38223.1 Pimeloyl-ACP methyl ester carboxylesterase [Haloarchaeobius iranensis]
MPDVEHAQTIVNDVRLHYVEAGDPDDETVVLLHGFPEYWYTWHRQLPALADAGYHVVAPDMRGYNTSEKPYGKDAYTLGRLSRDVVGLVEAFGETAHVVGHDWGGVVAWDLGARHPDVVETLSVLNAPHLGAFQRELLRNPGQLRRSWYAIWFQVPWLPERLFAAASSRIFPELFAAGTNSDDACSGEDIHMFEHAFTLPGTPTSAINYYRALFRTLGLSMLPLVGGEGPPLDVDVPTQLLWGLDDKALSPALTEGLGEWVSDLRVVRFPDASHWLHLDEPDAVTDSLREFFDAHD